MNIDLPDNLNSSLSSRTEALARVREVSRVASAAMQRFQELMRPISEAVALLQSKFSDYEKVLKSISRPIIAIRKLGDAQYIFWEFMPRSFADEIIESENVNKTLRERLVKEKFSSVDDTIRRCQSSLLMKRHLRIYNQSVSAFQNGNSDLAVIGFTSIVDGLLSDVSGNQTTRIAARVTCIIDKLENNEDVDSNEYALLTLMLTFQRTMDSFSANSDFARKEPKGLNRHWIMHGRSKRKKTKLDCVKLINMIQGILLIDEFGRKEAEGKNDDVA